MINFVLVIGIWLAFVAGLMFFGAGLSGPTAIQESAGGTLASASWIMMMFLYMLYRDRK